LKIAHHSVVQPFAAIPDADAKPHHGIAMRVCQALGSANAATLSESRNYLDLLL
jgi:hypothetical protein